MQIIPTAFDTEDWLRTTNAKAIQLWMEVLGEPGYFEPEVQQIDLDQPDGVWDKVEYPEFFWWRDDNKKLVRPEPKDPIQSRCPRCYSTKIAIGYPNIKCQNCGLCEPLIDFPISHYYHLASAQEFNERKGN